MIIIDWFSNARFNFTTQTRPVPHIHHQCSHLTVLVVLIVQQLCSALTSPYTFPQTAMLIRKRSKWCEVSFVLERVGSLWQQFLKSCMTWNGTALAYNPPRVRNLHSRGKERQRRWTDGKREQRVCDEREEKKRRREEKFSLDPKTNNDSSYNRNKPSQLCQTQALHLKGRTEKKKEKKLSLNKRPALLISGKVFTTNRLRPFICFWYQFPSISPWLITVVGDI